MTKKSTAKGPGQTFEKNFYPGKSAAVCASDVLSRSDVQSGEKKVGYLELVRTPSGKVMGTLVVIGDKKPSKTALNNYGKQIIDAAKADTAKKGAFGSMNAAASRGEIEAQIKEPTNEDAKKANVRKAANAKKKTSNGSNADTAKKKATNQNKAAATKTTSGAKASKKTSSKKRANANTKKSSKRKSQPAPPPPKIDQEYEEMLRREAAALREANERELASVGLSNNVSGYPVEPAHTTGGYRISTGVDASQGGNPQGVRAITHETPAYSGGVVVGGYNQPMNTGLPAVFPGPASHVPFGGTTQGPAENFEEAWEAFKRAAMSKAAGNSVSGARQAQLSLDAYDQNRSLYP